MSSIHHCKSLLALDIATGELVMGWNWWTMLPDPGRPKKRWGRFLSKHDLSSGSFVLPHAKRSDPIHPDWPANPMRTVAGPEHLPHWSTTDFMQVVDHMAEQGRYPLMEGPRMPGDTWGALFIEHGHTWRGQKPCEGVTAGVAVCIAAARVKGHIIILENLSNAQGKEN